MFRYTQTEPDPDNAYIFSDDFYCQLLGRFLNHCSLMTICGKCFRKPWPCPQTPSKSWIVFEEAFVANIHEHLPMGYLKFDTVNDAVDVYLVGIQHVQNPIYQDTQRQIARLKKQTYDRIKHISEWYLREREKVLQQYRDMIEEARAETRNELNELTRNLDSQRQAMREAIQMIIKK